MINKILFWVACVLPLSTFAADTYNNNQLTIPSVQVGSSTYTNVVVTIGAVVSIGSGGPNGFIDTYNLANGQLNIPSVIVGSNAYTNVVITIGSIVSIGTFYNTIQNNSTAATSAVVIIGM
jgi:hypothetical protein